jgi:hypothetical protein
MPSTANAMIHALFMFGGRSWLVGWLVGWLVDVWFVWLGMTVTLYHARFYTCPGGLPLVPHCGWCRLLAGAAVTTSTGEANPLLVPCTTGTTILGLFLRSPINTTCNVTNVRPCMRRGTWWRARQGGDSGASTLRLLPSCWHFCRSPVPSGNPKLSGNPCSRATSSGVIKLKVTKQFKKTI